MGWFKDNIKKWFISEKPKKVDKVDDQFTEKYRVFFSEEVFKKIIDTDVQKFPGLTEKQLEFLEEAKLVIPQELYNTLLDGASFNVICEIYELFNQKKFDVTYAQVDIPDKIEVIMDLNPNDGTQDILDKTHYFKIKKTKKNEKND